MQNDGFEFGPIQPRGTQHYFSEEGVKGAKRAMEDLLQEDNRKQQYSLEKVKSIAESQGGRMRRLLPLDESQDEELQLMSWLEDADKHMPAEEPSRIDGYQEFPLLWRPNSTVTVRPAYDFLWSDVGGGAVGEVYPRVNTGGVLGGKCTMTLGGDAHVHTGNGFWFFTGQFEGDMEVLARFSTWGRSVVYATFSYAFTQVRLNTGFWSPSDGRWLSIARHDVYNDSTTLGLNWKDFHDHQTIAIATARVQPNRWYAVWGWCNIWTTVGGFATAGSNIRCQLRSVRVCID